LNEMIVRVVSGDLVMPTDWFTQPASGNTEMRVQTTVTVFAIFMRDSIMYGQFRTSSKLRKLSARTFQGLEPAFAKCGCGLVVGRRVMFILREE